MAGAEREFFYSLTHRLLEEDDFMQSGYLKIAEGMADQGIAEEVLQYLQRDPSMLWGLYEEEKKTFQRNLDLLSLKGETLKKERHLATFQEKIQKLREVVINPHSRSLFSE